MEKISKKEIRKVVTDLIEKSIGAIKLSDPSDKTKKSLIKLSRRFSTLLHDELKKQARLKTKALKKINENKLVKKLVKKNNTRQNLMKWMLF